MYPTTCVCPSNIRYRSATVCLSVEHSIMHPTPYVCPSNIRFVFDAVCLLVENWVTKSMCVCLSNFEFSITYLHMYLPTYTRPWPPALLAPERLRRNRRKESRCYTLLASRQQNNNNHQNPPTGRDTTLCLVPSPDTIVADLFFITSRSGGKFHLHRNSTKYESPTQTSPADDLQP